MRGSILGVKGGTPTLVIGLALVAASACRPAPEPTYNTLYRPFREVPEPPTENAIWLYRELAENAVAAAPGLNLSDDSIKLNDAKLQALVRDLTPILNRLAKAPNRIETTPNVSSLGGERRYVIGFRLIQLALVKRIEDSIAAGNFDQAVSDVLLAHQFGTRITRLGLPETLVGMRLIDQSRGFLAPRLGVLSAKQLDRLYAGLDQTLRETPDLKLALGAEEYQLRSNLQDLSDAHQNNSLAKFDALVGQQNVPRLRRLANLRGIERVNWFEGAKKDSDRLVQESMQRIDRWTPLVQKENETPWFDRSADRPWNSLFRHFLRTPVLFPDLNANYQAKTRLFALNAKCLSIVKTQRLAPTRLFTSPPHLVTDPYSPEGRPFIYRSAGREFRIFSLGPDQIQDDESDEAGNGPDIALEKTPPRVR